MKASLNLDISCPKLRSNWALRSPQTFLTELSKSFVLLISLDSSTNLATSSFVNTK